jgi:hypothetical protein
MGLCSECGISAHKLKKNRPAQKISYAIQSHTQTNPQLFPTEPQPNTQNPNAKLSLSRSLSLCLPPSKKGVEMPKVPSRELGTCVCARPRARACSYAAKLIIKRNPRPISKLIIIKRIPRPISKLIIKGIPRLIPKPTLGLTPKPIFTLIPKRIHKLIPKLICNLILKPLLKLLLRASLGRAQAPPLLLL